MFNLENRPISHISHTFPVADQWLSKPFLSLWRSGSIPTATMPITHTEKAILEKKYIVSLCQQKLTLAARFCLES